jgi:hypothetical protein
MKKVAVVTGASAGIGEATVKSLIQATRPKTRYVVGAYAKPMVFMLTFLPDRFNDWFVGAITKSLLKQQRKESATQIA